ncbi:MAG: zinc ribbon domain-containing protein [Elusimicrobiaceae bacterium]|nr:zinc ribbon domain-containing protein [Elusimicrobiaceae bacterium]
MNLSKQPLTCQRCHLLVEETDNFCRHCGRSLKQGHSFFYSHSGIILMALVLGPFALPFVLLSKRISTLSKIIYTVVLLIMGVYLVIACYHIYQLMLSFSQDLLNVGI